MKEYECVQFSRHEDVGRTVGERPKNGWRFHSYQVAGMGEGPMSFKVNHYLLFERGS